MAEFEVGGVQYRSGRMNAFQQFHVGRKLAPIFGKMGPSLMTMGSPDTATMGLLAPILDALAEMPEDDCNYILFRCLAVVQRFQPPSSWAQVWNEPAKRLMFDDIDVQNMLQITWHVLEDNLGNFLLAPNSNSQQPVQEASSTLANLSPFPTAKIG